MEDAMVTRKTASKTTPAKTAKTAPRAQSKPAAKSAGKPAAAPATAAPARQQKVQAPAVETPTGEARYRWIAHAAYLRAEKRGFAPGREVDDWLAAEAEFVAAFGAG
jgi:hypothetical protein